jgi:beta-lactamase class A
MILKKKVPLYYVVLSAILGVSCTFLYFSNKSKNDSAEENTTADNATAKNAQSGYYIQHLKGYKYISPIIYAEPVSESDKYALLKGAITNFIELEKASGQVNNVSVYMKDFNGGDWLAIDPGEPYYPGSLLKVGVLMTYLRMAEKNHDLMKKEVVYQVKKGFVFPTEHYKAKTVEDGHKYTIKELIDYMIKYSDNGATVFLENMMDTTIFKNEFADLGITEPQFNNPDYMLNVKEYSNIFKALYSAGYLKRRASDSALSLLTQTVFRDGLVKELPASAVVAHKFGESGNDNIHELHESGIVYLDNNPYMLTVMTRGTDWNRLSGVLGHISKMVYDKMAGPNDNNASYQTAKLR